MSDARWLGRKEASKYCSFSVSWIDKLRDRGEIPYRLVQVDPAVRGKILIDSRDLDRWIESHPKVQL